MEQNVGRANELHEGELREVTIGETPVLLACSGGAIHALGARCKHYGAPLAEGALIDGRIICPWHHACYSATTGAVLEPPALDSLEQYPLRIVDGSILVSIPPEAAVPSAAASSAPADRISIDQFSTIAIVGGGAAGHMAAQTLRELGARQRIVMYTAEKRLPYDRPNLSKEYLSGHADPAWMPLRDMSFYGEHAIEVVEGRRVEELDAEKKTLRLDDGSVHPFTIAIVATGASPRTLDVPGAELANVFTLRSFDDAEAIIAATAGAKRAVVVGASFIAMETAASLRARGLDVTVVAPDDVPFARTLGAELGGLFRQEHERNGVRFRLGASVERIEGSQSVSAVVLSNSERIETDLIVAGIGVRPATEFLRGLALREDGGVTVDVRMKAADGIFAAGDIAAFPLAPDGDHVRIEHWRTAMQTGQVAARSICGVGDGYDDIPFFWTQQFELGLQYVGHAGSWDEIRYDGDVASRHVIATYYRGGRALAAASIGRDRELIEIGERLRAHRQ
jgi:NADPH-dependent 2,4-dienoyl-CoA reductase/sulfur reductase-like enzyme/nitrite reductase/ring-hydroxylating ferredoxin subunit